MKKDIIIKIALLFIGALFLFSLIHRIPNIDDAWLGEHAYWMAKLGYVKSELMSGITHQEDRLICHHKLFTLQGALLIKLFGFSLVILKSLTLLYFILFLAVYYFSFYKKVFSKSDFLLSLLLLFANALVFEESFVYRPEISVMALGFISYLFIDKALNNKKSPIIYAIAGGLFAGLCFASHLNGIIFPMAGFIILLWNRKVLLSFIFGLSTIPTIAIYFYDFTSTYNVSYWLYQINEAPALDGISKMPIWLTFLHNLLNEHLRFFHSPFEIAFSVLFLAAFILVYKKLKEHKNLIRYTGLLVLFLALVSVHKASYYMIVYIPFLIIIITLCIRELNKKSLSTTTVFRKVTYKQAMLILNVLIVLYLTVNFARDFKVSNTKYNCLANKEIELKYIQGKTDSCKIVAPLTFVFDEILNFKSIQGDMCFTEMQKADKSIYKEGFLQLTRKFGIDYIILPKSSIEALGVNKLTSEDFARNDCVVLLKSDSLFILKNIKPEEKTASLLNGSVKAL